MIQLLNNLAIQIIRNAYRSKDIAILNSLGMNQEDIELIGDLNANDIAYLQSLDLSIINISIDVPLLQKSIERSKAYAQHQKLIKEAIILGATREIMRNYGSLSFKQFNEIKKLLGIKGNQLSSSISSDQVNQLDQILKSTFLEQSKSEKVRLRLSLLVAFAKSTNIPIRSILTHITEFWGHHYEL